jgi:hypothetical protein
VMSKCGAATGSVGGSCIHTLIRRGVIIDLRHTVTTLSMAVKSKSS